ncbi:exopolyphosphatase/guanosine-5'-triphosphate,3'-diphosphate pyrophosphatase [Arthrobacter pascens]|uniref:Ppx/GppA phosphatase family protein n=1 Tax=Arthrobacter pascens TaxID=1677 RepID=UPI00278ACD9B|nr:Ppx/GppA phosphatase family protein [Arthrobacter pascens]MDQ0634913.1 exopolyphosphatase/guanosine-5'-triphosphate,3'-diphosphate pyrophosphatase [Arthrobacter pascens]
MTRVAAIDCGTNSIRLLIADVDRSNGRAKLTDVVREMRVVRLGQGVDATGELAPEALERTFAATADYARMIGENGVVAVRFVATSASRDARNRQVFVDGIRSLLGVEPEVITGDEEAALSFAGASSVLPILDGHQVLVIDLGGGSTEFVLGTADGVTAGKSVDVGCVRLTERHLRDDPPTAEQIAAAEADVDAAITRVERDVPLERATAVVGVAGSVTTITAHALRLPQYSPEVIHGTELSIDAIRGAATDLLEMKKAQRAELPYMHPGRVDVIGAGGLVWRRVLERLNELTEGRIVTATASEHDILDGIALSIS